MRYASNGNHYSAGLHFARRRCPFGDPAVDAPGVPGSHLHPLVVQGEGPFNWVMVGGKHIHHLVWGILILLFVGYGWLLDLGRAHSPMSILLSRIMSIAYGVGAALTLDEFALWLNLDPDVYWVKTGGRLSIDAVVLFGSILMIGAWGAPFFQSLQRLWTKGGTLRHRMVKPIRRVPWPRRRKGPRSVPRIGS